MIPLWVWSQIDLLWGLRFPTKWEQLPGVLINPRMGFPVGFPFNQPENNTTLRLKNTSYRWYVSKLEWQRLPWGSPYPICSLSFVWFSQIPVTKKTDPRWDELYSEVTRVNEPCLSKNVTPPNKSHPRRSQCMTPVKILAMHMGLSQRKRRTPKNGNGVPLVCL